MHCRCPRRCDLVACCRALTSRRSGQLRRKQWCGPQGCMPHRCRSPSDAVCAGFRCRSRRDRSTGSDQDSEGGCRGRCMLCTRTVCTIAALGTVWGASSLSGLCCGWRMVLLRPVPTAAAAGRAATRCRLPSGPFAWQGGALRRAVWWKSTCACRQRLSRLQALHPRTGRTSHGAADLPGRSRA